MIQAEFGYAVFAPPILIENAYTRKIVHKNFFTLILPLMIIAVIVFTNASIFRARRDYSREEITKCYIFHSINVRFAY